VDLACPAASLAHLALVRKPDLDPALDRSGQVALHQVGLVLAAEAASEFQPFPGMEGERENPHHHALVRLGRMARDRERVVGVVAAIDVRDRELHPEDRGFERHGTGTIHGGL
jgi:hypothetical protein